MVEWKEENKILLINSNFISDLSQREFFRSEQDIIMQKRAQTFNMFGQYFQDIKVSETGHQIIKKNNLFYVIFSIPIILYIISVMFHFVFQ